MLWDALDTNNFFYFLFFLILYGFCFSFLFLLDDGEGHDMEVT